MAGFETFDLGRVIQTAEGIKALRRQEGEDVLRKQYMQTNIEGAQQQQQQQKQQFETENQARVAKTRYLEAGAILQSSDPIGTAKMYAPELIQKFNEHNGEGAFDRLQPEQVKQLVSQAQAQLAAAAGIQPKVKYIDLGGQQIAIDENTGHPLANAPPLQKSASPESLLSAQTSTQNAQLSASTALRGQDMSASTAVRGQDLAASTAEAGRDVTRRGQDLSSGAAGTKITEADKKNRVLIQGMQDAERSVQAAMKQTNPSGVGNAIAGRIPLTGDYFQSDEFKSYRAAAERWAANYLYLKSGAQAGKNEIDSVVTQFFPQVGEGKEVAGKKALARREEMSSALSVYGSASSGKPAPAAQQQGPITATGPNGAKLILQNGAWVPAGG